MQTRMIHRKVTFNSNGFLKSIKAGKNAFPAHRHFRNLSDGLGRPPAGRGSRFAHLDGLSSSRRISCSQGCLELIPTGFAHRSSTRAFCQGASVHDVDGLEVKLNPIESNEGKIEDEGKLNTIESSEGNMEDAGKLNAIESKEEKKGDEGNAWKQILLNKFGPELTDNILLDCSSNVFESEKAAIISVIAQHSSSWLSLPFRKQISPRVAVDTLIEIYSQCSNLERLRLIASMFGRCQHIRLHKSFFEDAVAEHRDDGVRFLLDCAELLDAHVSIDKAKSKRADQIELDSHTVENLIRARQSVREGLRRISGRSLTYVNQITPDLGENVVNRVFECEKVHDLRTLDEVNERFNAPNGLCLGLFSHALGPEDPLHYVNIAFTNMIPRNINDVLPGEPIANPNVACFWSINGCERGFRGLNHGSMLLSRAIEHFQAHQPGLERFVTFSPVYGFRRWLLRQCDLAEKQGLEWPRYRTYSASVRKLHVAMGDSSRRFSFSHHIRTICGDCHASWKDSENVCEALEPILTGLLHFYLDPHRPALKKRCAVAQFHFGNGAQFIQSNFLGDLSAKGIERSLGLMVNYEYSIDTMWRNQYEAKKKPYLKRLPRHSNNGEGKADAGEC